MNVGNICKRLVVTIRPTEELTTAAELMRERHVGYLIVTQTEFTSGLEKVVGVLTDRDIVVSVLARNTDPRTLRVGDVMTSDPVVVTESESITKALEQMRRMGIRRLPVVGTRNELVGVLSLDDVIDVLAKELQDVAGLIRNEQRIESALRP
ncbi:MAG TPA: CBS domain-containing protein [Steroidobacteraceae bacterium]